MANGIGTSVSSPEELFAKLMGTAGIQEQTEDGDETVISIKKDDLLIMSFGLANALLNVVVQKGIISKDEMIRDVAGAIAAVKDLFDSGEAEVEDED